MSASEALGRQFQPGEVAHLRAGDFAGGIGDEPARKRFKTSSEQGDKMRPEHLGEGGPLGHLDRFTESVRADGRIKEPVDVIQHDDYYSLRNGHHRALAAHALGMPLPYRVVGTRS